MGLKKISVPQDDWQAQCTSPEHNPPSMIVLEPGTYEWDCPQCGKVTRFVVPPGPMP